MSLTANVVFRSGLSGVNPLYNLVHIAVCVYLLHAGYCTGGISLTIHSQTVAVFIANSIYAENGKLVNPNTRLNIKQT